MDNYDVHDYRGYYSEFIIFGCIGGSPAHNCAPNNVSNSMSNVGCGISDLWDTYRQCCKFINFNGGAPPPGTPCHDATTQLGPTTCEQGTQFANKVPSLI